MAKPQKRWTGEEVKEFKEKHGLTLQQIADACELSTYVPVWRWVNQGAKPSPMACRGLNKLKAQYEKEAKK